MNTLDIELINLPRITDPRGNLTFAEAEGHVPFPVRRAYWVYDVPAGESRGGHAHKRLRQLVVVMNAPPCCSTTPGRDCSST